MNLVRSIESKVIVSGIGAGIGGVGRFIQYLAREHKDLKVLYPKRVSSSLFVFKSILKVIRLLVFNLKLLSIRNKRVVILSHNYINSVIFKYLLRKNECWVYMMDNNFFCIQSYNFNNTNKEECLKCLGGNFHSAFEYSCSVQPLIRSRKKAVKFNRKILQLSDLFHLVTLSETSLKLAKRHFSNAKSLSSCYFLTEDILENTLSPFYREKHYDIVFHGADSEIKGMSYVLELAGALKETTFFFPTSSIDVDLDNVDSADVRWELGLDNLVRNAKIVCSPSIWSNTPEAAVLKNIVTNGVTAVRENEYGFNQEMPRSAFISLSGEVEVDSKLILSYLESTPKREAIKIDSQAFINEYRNRANTELRKLLYH